MKKNDGDREGMRFNNNGSVVTARLQWRMEGRGKGGRLSIASPPRPLVIN